MSLGEDDIGDFFLDSDENNLNRDSFDFVFFALNLALKKNLKLTKIYIKLFVSNVICDDLLKQDALFKIQNSLSYKLKINQNILSFEISTPFSINGSIARSEGIESQVFIFFEKEI
jgi:2C-methyl-D-erythritol 2,4-cyclodiphosphate synthase